MKKSLLTALAIAVLLISLAEGIRVAEAQSLTITIKVDGSIDPSTAAIQRDGNTYVVTGELDGSITVERGNIVVDGANHTLQGPGSDKNFIAISLMVSNVTIDNLRVSGWRAGVYGAFNNNTITNNVFVGNYQGIALYADDYVVSENSISGSDTAILVDSGAIRPQGDNNLIIRNQIANNNWAFDILNSNGTTIAENNVTGNGVILTLGTQRANISIAGFHMLYNNNFINNRQTLHIPFGGPTVVGVVPVSPAGQWDNGAAGNYWSDYPSRYPNATEIDHSGIGDTLYIIEDSTTWARDYANGTHLEGTAVLGTATDRYPLLTPYDISNSTIRLPYPSPSPNTSSTPFPSSSPKPSPSPSPSPTPTPSPSSSQKPSPSPTHTTSQQPILSQEPSATIISPTDLVLVTVAGIIALSIAATAIFLTVTKKRKAKAQ
jgi:parallel beta-helix repeat protein